ncbi:hypothetical protein EGR_05411 [Echinococcus granulosus]|uniref:Uncharacterized protein n=1 Tax=Echinococcus granulosus TaxID=6210 RepID=W6UFS7_ECHGR|nr:hypothetical protein EGR_05411 [Echinococcus granulosus]EUB59791.1 hypothetical protein EGR_05411 [Echinococcus granulosus]
MHVGYGVEFLDNGSLLSAHPYLMENALHDLGHGYRQPPNDSKEYVNQMHLYHLTPVPHKNERYFHCTDKDAQENVVNTLKQGTCSKMRPLCTSISRKFGHLTSQLDSIHSSYFVFSFSGISVHLLCVCLNVLSGYSKMANLFEISR